MALVVVAVFSSLGLGEPTGGGGREVQLRDGAGGFTSYRNIPRSSRFAKHGSSGGGAPKPCKYSVFEVVEVDGKKTRKETVKNDGEWIFQAALANDDEELGQLIDGLRGVRWKPIPDQFIRFDVACRNPKTDEIDWLKYPDQIDVSIRDPFFWDRATLDRLRADLKLKPIEINSPASVAKWGGLIVRNPVALQVNAAAWDVQASPVVKRHGVSLAVVARPQKLSFQLTFEPNERAKPDAKKQTWNIVCTPEYEVASSAWFPDSKLPDFSAETGLYGDQCAWVPPDSGEVTIQATITYDIYEVVSGVTEGTPPYVWSNQLTVTTGQLRAVNVKD